MQTTEGVVVVGGGGGGEERERAGKETGEPYE